MEAKSKDAPKTKDVLKQLQAELRHLQNAVGALQHADPPTESEGEAAPHRGRTDKSDWAVQYTVQQRAANGEPTFKTGTISCSAAQLGRVTDEAAATLGYALSSPQKVALLRALLVGQDEASAAALGSAASLSTGSLYHHLHDLMHSGLIGQSARNRYVLTDRGRRVLLVLLALAAQP